MTASPIVAEPVPDAVPVPPATGRSPAAHPPTARRGAAEPPPAQGSSSCSSCCSASSLLLGLAIWYLLFRQPIPIPTIPGETESCRATSTAIYGADRPMGVAVNAAGDRIYVGRRPRATGSRVVFDAQGNKLGEDAAAALDRRGARAGLPRGRPGHRRGLRHRPARPASIYIYDAARHVPADVRPPARRSTGWQPLGDGVRHGRQPLRHRRRPSTPQEVLVFDRTASVVRTLGTTAGLNFPNGVAVDKAGNVYVTDSNNGRLLVFDADGQVVGAGRPRRRRGQPRPAARRRRRRRRPRLRRRHHRPGRSSCTGPTSPATGPSTTSASSGARASPTASSRIPTASRSTAAARLYVADTANDRVQMWSY